MSNFCAVQSFYQEHGHLSIRDNTLSQWLTYQRYHAKTLSDRKVALLESIRYKDEKLFGGPVQSNEKWKLKYLELKKFVSEKGSAVGLPPGLRCWVTRQINRFDANSLDPDRQQKLEALGIKLSEYRKRASSQAKKAKYDGEWMANYEKLNVLA